MASPFQKRILHFSKGVVFFLLFLFGVCGNTKAELLREAPGSPAPDGSGNPESVQAGKYRLVVGSYPENSQLTDSLILNGERLYSEIRVMVIAVELCAEDHFGFRADERSQSYHHAADWGSITGGSLPGFTGALTTQPASGFDGEQINNREIVFRSTEPVAVSKLPLLLNLTLPGADPDYRIHLFAEISLQITFRDKDCAEREQLVKLYVPFPVNNPVFFSLSKTVDAGYYLLTDNMLNFKYNEEYAPAPNARLQFKIYNSIREVKTIANTYDYLVHGDNRFSFNCKSLPKGYYILEVKNDKNETWYLRFYKS